MDTEQKLPVIELRQKRRNFIIYLPFIAFGLFWVVNALTLIIDSFKSPSSFLFFSILFGLIACVVLVTCLSWCYFFITNLFQPNYGLVINQSSISFIEHSFDNELITIDWDTIENVIINENEEFIINLKNENNFNKHGYVKRWLIYKDLISDSQSEELKKVINIRNLVIDNMIEFEYLLQLYKKKYIN